MTTKQTPRDYERGKAAYLAGHDFIKNPWPLFDRAGRPHKQGMPWHKGWLDAWTETHKKGGPAVR